MDLIIVPSGIEMSEVKDFKEAPAELIIVPSGIEIQMEADSLEEQKPYNCTKWN